MKNRYFWKNALIAMLLFMALVINQALAQANMIENGDFQAGIEGWTISPMIAPNWNPILEDGTNRYISLHPIYPWGFSGVVVYQNLNVSLGTNKAVDFTVFLKKSWSSEAKPLAFKLEYVDSTTNSLHTVLLAEPDATSISGTEFVQVSNSVVLPPSARKITKFSIVKRGWGEFFADNITIGIAGAIKGPLPRINSISENNGAYGTDLVITGMSFGANTGSVLLAGSTSGINILSWSDTSITVKIQEPAQAGRVMVVSDFVASNIDQAFKVTSPYFALNVYPQELTVVRGAKATYGVSVKFYNNFASPGGITFVLGDAPNQAGVSEFVPVPVKSTGGTVLSVNTSTLTPGIYKGLVKSVEANSAERTSPIQLTVVEVGEIRYTAAYDDDTPITSLAINRQGNFGLTYKVFDVSGNEMPFTVMGREPVFLSSDPLKLLVYRDQWGSYFYAQDSGGVNLTARTIDGRENTLEVIINVPDSPKIISISLSPSQVTSEYTDPITFFAQGTSPISSWGSSGDFMDYDSRNIEFNASNQSVGGTFKIRQGIQPGQYRMAATVDSAERQVILDVVNDPGNGWISGTIKTAGGAEGPAGQFHGQVRFYNAATGEMVKEVMLFAGDAYKIALKPGNYKVEVMQYGSPFFYFNAADLAGATPVMVSAGQESGNVNFVLLPGLNMFGMVREEGVDGSDIPVAGAYIEIFDIKGTFPLSSASSYPDGTFYMGGLVPNTEGYARITKDQYKDTYTYIHRIEGEDIPDARLEIIPLARFDEIKSSIEAALQITYDSSKGLIGGSVVQLLGDHDLDIPGVVVELWNQDATQKIADLSPIYINSLGQPDNTLGATTSDGGFAFINVPLGIYTIKAFLDGEEKGSVKAGAFANGVTLGHIEMEGVLPPYIVTVFSAHQAAQGFGLPEEQYRVGLMIEDPESRATSVIVSGPGITNSLQLVFDPAEKKWASWLTPQGNPNFGSTQPALPLVYEFTMIDNSGSLSVQKTINSFVNIFATNLSPAGIVNNPVPTFSWQAEVTNFKFGLELYNQTWERIWSAHNLAASPKEYGGPALMPGFYNYIIVINDTEGNGSLTPGSFTYQPIEDRGDLNGDRGLTLDDAIIALRVISNIQVSGLIYEFPKNDADGVQGIGLGDAIFVLQKLATMR